MNMTLHLPSSPEDSKADMAEEKNRVAHALKGVLSLREMANWI